MGDVVPPRMRIGIVEDHLRYREALQATIDSIDDLVVVWLADDSGDALARLTEDPVDLVIVDLSLPGGSGAALIGLIRERWPSTECVVVSGHTENHYVRRSFESGAIAYVVKGRPSDLREGIAAAREHREYRSPQLQ